MKKLLGNKIIWELPLRTVSEANCSQHWRTKSKRHNLQQFFVRKLFNSLESPIELPCCVKMIRLAPMLLDEEDNLRMAFKWIKDEISVCLVPEKRTYYTDKKGKLREVKGRADDDKRIKWEYGQEKARKLGIRIEISMPASGENHPDNTTILFSDPLNPPAPF